MYKTVIVLNNIDLKQQSQLLFQTQIWPQNNMKYLKKMHFAGHLNKK